MKINQRIRLKLDYKGDPVFLTILVCILMVVICGALINYSYQKTQDIETQAYENQINDLQDQLNRSVQKESFFKDMASSTNVLTH